MSPGSFNDIAGISKVPLKEFLYTIKFIQALKRILSNTAILPACFGLTNYIIKLI